MSEIKEINGMVTLPVVPLRGLVAFPNIQLNIEIVRPFALKAFTTAATNFDAKVVLVAQKDIACDEPKGDDLYKMGVIAEIKHVVKNPRGNLNVVFEGISRIKIKEYTIDSGFISATGVTRAESKHTSVPKQISALVFEIKRRLSDIKDIHPSFTEELRLNAEAITEYGYFADFVASSAIIDYKNKQTVLEALLLKTRLEKLLVALEEEAMLLECEHDIQMQVREKIDRNQKDYFLREQIKAIQSELGDDEDDELKDYDERITKSNMPIEIKEQVRHGQDIVTAFSERGNVEHRDLEAVICEILHRRLSRRFLEDAAEMAFADTAKGCEVIRGNLFKITIADLLNRRLYDFKVADMLACHLILIDLLRVITKDHREKLHHKSAKRKLKISRSFLLHGNGTRNQCSNACIALDMCSKTKFSAEKLSS